MSPFMGYFMLGSAFLIIVSMAVNSFGTKTVLFLCIFCFIIDRPDGVDIALLYALMNFIATIAVLKYFNYQALDTALTQADEVERGEM